MQRQLTRFMRIVAAAVFFIGLIMAVVGAVFSMVGAGFFLSLQYISMSLLGAIVYQLCVLNGSREPSDEDWRRALVALSARYEQKPEVSETRPEQT